MADVAQLVRALGCGSRGRGFDPRRLPHFFNKPKNRLNGYFISRDYRHLHFHEIEKPARQC